MQENNVNMQNNINPQNNKNNKINKTLIVIIVVISIILIGVISFTIYSSMSPKEESIKEESANEQEKVKSTDKIKPIKAEDAEIMIKQITTYNQYLSTIYPIDDINQIDSKLISDLAYTRIPNISYGPGESFMQTDLEKVIAQFFGNDYEVKHQDIPCFCDEKIMFKYDSAKRNYSFYGMHGHGGQAYNSGYTNFIDGTYNETQKTYTINTKIIYRNPIGDTAGPATHYYANGKDAMDQTNPIYTVTEEEIMTLQPGVVYDTLKEQLKITSYEFKVDSDGNYGLTKVTIK